MGTKELAVMEAKELIKVDQKALAGFVKEAELMRTDINSLQVNSLPKYKFCLLKRDEAKAFQKRIIIFFKKMKDLANATHKQICKDEREALAPHLENVRIADKKAGVWYQEEQRKAEEKARKEREKLEKIAEDKRKKDAEKLQEEAEELAEQGHTEEAELAIEAAEQIVDEPIVVPSVQVKSRAAGLGFGMIDNWKALVMNIDQVPREYMMPDMEKLNRLAKTMKGKNSPAGVEFVNEAYSKSTRR